MKHYQQVFDVFKTMLTVNFAVSLLMQPSYAQEQNIGAPRAKEMTRLLVSIDDKPIVLLIKDNVVLAGHGWKEITPIDEDDEDNAWYAIVTDDNDKMGYIDNQVEWLIEPRFDEAKAFSKDNLARVKTDGRWWFIDLTGNDVFDKTFAQVSAFSHGYAAVRETEHGDSYFIDVTDKKVFGKDFANAKGFSDNGLAVVAVGDKVPVYDITEAGTSVTSVNANVRSGYIDTQGKFAIAPKFLEARDFNEFNLAQVSTQENERFLIDTNGDPISDKTYQYIANFSDAGLAKVTPIQPNSGFEGYINTQGEELFKLDSYWYDYRNGRILVNNRFYDTKGKEVIDYSQWAQPFYDKWVTLALREGDWGILGRNGTFIPFADNANNIEAPMTVGNQAVGFVDGIVPMLNDRQSISYFDRQGTVRYHFEPGATGKMVLSDNDHDILWQSKIPNQPLKNFLTFKNHDFIVFDSNENFADSLISAVIALLNAEPRRYYIPNPIFWETDANPYEITPEVLEDEAVQQGAMKVVAEDYVNANRYGNFELLGEARNRSFEQLYAFFVDALTKEYGKPLQTKDEYNQWQTSTGWQIGTKVLTLSWLSDAGDGDFYNQLVLEVN